MRHFLARHVSCSLIATLAVLVLTNGLPAAVDAATTSPGTLLTQHLPQPRRSVSASPATPIVYVSETAENTIVVYPQSGPLTPITTISTGLSAPAGTWVDQQQNLWVANAGTTGQPGFVLVFAPSTSKPRRKITVPASYGPPQHVWVDSDGTVYTVECPNSVCNITQFDTTGKWHVINDPHLTTVTGIVGDGAGDLYAEGTDRAAQAATVEVRAGGTWEPTYFPLFTKPAQIAWDQNGELVIESAVVGNVFYYEPQRG